MPRAWNPLELPEREQRSLTWGVRVRVRVRVRPTRVRRLGATHRGQSLTHWFQKGCIT